jgi:hypothetical protein
MINLITVRAILAGRHFDFQFICAADTVMLHYDNPELKRWAIDCAPLELRPAWNHTQLGCTCT